MSLLLSLLVLILVAINILLDNKGHNYLLLDTSMITYLIGLFAITINQNNYINIVVYGLLVALWLAIIITRINNNKY